MCPVCRSSPALCTRSSASRRNTSRAFPSLRLSSVSSASVNSEPGAIGSTALAERPATTTKYMPSGGLYEVMPLASPSHASAPSIGCSGQISDQGATRWWYHDCAGKDEASSAASPSRYSSCRWNSLTYLRASLYRRLLGDEMISNPSGLSTRANSASIFGWSAASRCSMVSNDTTASTEASGSGSAEQEPVTKRTRSPSPYRSLAWAMAEASMSTPTTLGATAPRSALPYPSPQAASSTRLPAANRRANAYRCQCSYAISRAQPGTKRSPVNVISEAMQGQFQERRSARRSGKPQFYPITARQAALWPSASHRCRRASGGR